MKHASSIHCNNAFEQMITVYIYSSTHTTTSNFPPSISGLKLLKLPQYFYDKHTVYSFEFAQSYFRPIET